MYIHTLYICVYIYTYVCTYICIYTYVCVYTYICIYTYIWSERESLFIICKVYFPTATSATCIPTPNKPWKPWQLGVLRKEKQRKDWWQCTPGNVVTRDGKRAWSLESPVWISDSSMARGWELGPGTQLCGLCCIAEGLWRIMYVPRSLKIIVLW